MCSLSPLWFKSERRDPSVDVVADMARLFVGNFDFEHELAGVQRSTAAALSDRQVPLWIPVAAADDLVLTTSPFAPEDFPDLLALDWPLPRFVTPAELPSPPPHCELVP